MTHQMPKFKVELSPSKFFLFGLMIALQKWQKNAYFILKAFFGLKIF